MPGPITNGKDFNFYQRMVVSSGTFQSNADVVFNFRGQEGLLLINEGTGVVEVSFNGTTVHARLDSSNAATNKMQFDHRRVSRIWLRTTSGTPTIQVQAWVAA